MSQKYDRKQIGRNLMNQNDNNYYQPNYYYNPENSYANNMKYSNYYSHQNNQELQKNYHRPIFTRQNVRYSNVPLNIVVNKNRYGYYTPNTNESKRNIESLHSEKTYINPNINANNMKSLESKPPSSKERASPHNLSNESFYKNSPLNLRKDSLRDPLNKNQKEFFKALRKENLLLVENFIGGFNVFLEQQGENNNKLIKSIHDENSNFLRELFGKFDVRIQKKSSQKMNKKKLF